VTAAGLFLTASGDKGQNGRSPAIDHTQHSALCTATGHEAMSQRSHQHCSITTFLSSHRHEKQYQVTRKTKDI